MILFLRQLLFTASFSADLTLTGIVSHQLPPDTTLATLPYSLITHARDLPDNFWSFDPHG